MDDNEVCPLCCEELDISDKQFFPCKCGYQVCMWCWHRIRETESGLCPACRTPYGDDPHEFSAVDVQEVLKANKEKAAAEKREKERQKHSIPPPVKLQHHHTHGGTVSMQGSGIPSFSHVAGDGIGGGGSGGSGVTGGIGTVGPGGHFLSAAAVAAAENSVATPLDNSSGIIHFGGHDNKTTTVIDRSRSLDPPKDRSSLANMRVIRRTLVYAVGLPQDCASEHLLNRPEYFGQYGKISKVVVNKNYSGNGDPRRASASVYVTFVHKEDTLACILALDGFVLDGRHIRASYGTSKYCSAFIKNVRCSNPECTYLHHLGLPEDSFTKQEIQAGYVTSGRDVLAKQQAAMAVAASANGRTRKRVGGGGPSGTGTASAHPVLPAPEYDEPVRTTKSGSSFVAPPVGSKHGRSISVGASPSTSAPNSGNAPSGFAAVAAGVASTSGNAGGTTPAPIPITKIRPPAVVASLSSKPTPAAASASSQASGVSSASTNNKTSSSSGAGSTSANSIPSSSAPTAASVVASAKAPSPPSVPPPPHTTLTSLTPLKRSTSLPGGKSPPAKNASSSTATTSTATPSKASVTTTTTTSTTTSLPAASAGPAAPVATATPLVTAPSSGAATTSPTTPPAPTTAPSGTTTKSDKTAPEVVATPAESKSSGANTLLSSTTVTATATASSKAVGAIGSSRKQGSKALPSPATAAVSVGSSRSGGEDNSLDSAKSSLEGDVIGGTAIFGSGILSEGSSVLSNGNDSLNGFLKTPGPSLMSPNNSFGAIGPAPPQPQHQPQNGSFGAIGSSYGARGVIGEKAPGPSLSSGNDWKSGDMLLNSSSGDGGGLWGSVGSSPKHEGIPNAATKSAGVGVIGSSRSPSSKAPGGELFVGGPSLGSSAMGGVLGRDSGTTALASMLGISLPAQGSGSLRDTLQGQNHSVNAPRPGSFSFSSVPIGGLNESKNAHINQQTSPWPNDARGIVGPGAGSPAGVGIIGGLNNNLHYQPAPIGSRSPVGRSAPPQALHHDSVIGGGPLIGGPSPMASDRAPGAGRPNTNQEIALLQSLLPGVHVTTSSGGNPPPFSSMAQQHHQHMGHAGWSAAPGARVVGAPSVIGSGRQSSFGGGVIGAPNHGAIGDQNPAAWAAAPGGGFYGHQQADHRPQQHRQGGNIW